MPLLAIPLSNAPSNVQNLVANVNWAQPSWDLFIVLFFIIAGFLYGLSLGRDRVIVILVSIYMALAVVSNAPILNRIQSDLSQFVAFRVTTFLGLFVLLFFLLSRSALLNTFSNLNTGKWWQALIFSTFHVGLLVSITLSFLPPESINHLAHLTQTLFASQGARFFWIAAPIVGMVLLKP